MRLNLNNFASKILRLSALLVFVLFLSCSKDDANLPINEEESIDDSETIDDSENSGNETTDEFVFETNFTLDDSHTVANFVLSQNDYNTFIQGEGDFKMVSEKVYQYLNDDFDFIIILSVEEEQPADLYFGISKLIQNSVQGLGSNTFNSAQSFGSADRLKSIIYMPKTEYVRNGPFLHEIAHTWGNKGFIPSTIGGHWGYASTAGQLGGFDELIELSNNTYKGRLNNRDGFGGNANGGNSIPYGNLELYVMGLIGPNDLETVKVAMNPVNGTARGEFTADEIQTFTAEQLIANNGVRVPSSDSSQKAFKALTVVISSEILSVSKIDEVKLNLENFSKQENPDASWGTLNNFWMATKGKATFDFEVTTQNVK